MLIVAQPRKRGRPLELKNKRKVNMYIIKKEEDNYKLALKLRNNRVITTLGAPFKASNKQEISSLVGYRVFKFKLYNKELHGGI
jgi:hypothetical protein